MGDGWKGAGSGAGKKKGPRKRAAKLRLEQDGARKKPVAVATKQVEQVTKTAQNEHSAAHITDEYRAFQVRIDALLHSPPGMVVKDVELVDEDGVFLCETATSLLGAVAQEGGIVFEELGSVALLIPRNVKVEDPANKFDSSRDFRVVQGRELMAAVANWLLPKNVRSRLRTNRSRAIETIYTTLRRKSAMSGIVHSSDGSGKDLKDSSGRFSELSDEDPFGDDDNDDDDENAEEAKDDFFDDYDDLAAAHSLWELALERDNIKAMIGLDVQSSNVGMRHSFKEQSKGDSDKDKDNVIRSSDLFTLLVELIGSEKGTFESTLSVYLSGAMWALARDSRSRNRFVESEIIPLLFTILYQRNLLHLEKPPVSHIQTLGALRGFLEADSERSFLLRAVSKYDVDLLKFVAANMLTTQNRYVWNHLAAIVLRTILRSEDSLKEFIEDYAKNDGDPARVVQLICDVLDDTSFARAVAPGLGGAIKGNGKAGVKEDQNLTQSKALVVDQHMIVNTGTRLALSLLCARLARASPAGRSILQHNEASIIREAIGDGAIGHEVATKNLVQSLLRWSLHASCVGATRFSGTANKSDFIQMDSATVFDALCPLLMPEKKKSIATSSSKRNHLGHQKSMRSTKSGIGGVGDFSSTAGASSVTKNRTLKTVPPAPDVESAAALHFETEQWDMSSGRALEATLVNAALGLWGLAKSIGEAEANQKQMNESQNPKVSLDAANVNKAKGVTNDVITDDIDASVGEPLRCTHKLTEERIRMGNFLVDSETWTLGEQQVQREQSSEVGKGKDIGSAPLTDSLLSSVIGLALAARCSADAKPRVELCALSALNALAHSELPLVRKKLARITDASIKREQSTTESRRSLSRETQESISNSNQATVAAIEDRATEFGSSYAQLLSEAFMGSGIESVYQPSLERLIPFSGSTSSASQAYGMSALAGVLGTCLECEVPASAALPTLDIKELLGLCVLRASGSFQNGLQKSPSLATFASSRLKSQGKSQKTPGNERAGAHAKVNDESSSTVSTLACACVMLHALNPQLPVYQSSSGNLGVSEFATTEDGGASEASFGNDGHGDAHEKHDIPIWTEDACMGLLVALQGSGDDPSRANRDKAAQRASNRARSADPQSDSDAEDGFLRKNRRRGSLRVENNLIKEIIHPPVGSQLTYLSVAAWSLCRISVIRKTCLRIGFIPTLLNAAQQSLDMIDVFRAACDQLDKNESEALHLQRKTSRALNLSQSRSNLARERSQTSSSRSSDHVKESVADMQGRYLQGAKEHLCALNATLAAIWQQVENRDVFTKTEQSESDNVDALSAELGNLQDEITILKQSRSDLYKLVLRIVAAANVMNSNTSMDKKSSVYHQQEHEIDIQSTGSFKFAYNEHTELVDEIMRKSIGILWAVMALRVSDKSFCTVSLLQSLLDYVYNPAVNAGNRAMVAQCLAYADKLPARSLTSRSIRSRLEALVSPTYLCEIVLHFLGCNSEELRSHGADLLSRVRSTRIGQALIRNNGGIPILLDLAMEGSRDQVVTNALNALRHVALSETSQVALCRQGLYMLLELSWTATNVEHRRLIAQTLEQLGRNATNKTPMYKAELRARQVLGWRDISDPTEKERRAFKRDLDNFRKKGTDPHPKDSMAEAHFKGTGKVAKKGFIRWLDTLNVTNATADAAVSFKATCEVKSPTIKSIKAKRAKELRQEKESAKLGFGARQSLAGATGDSDHDNFNSDSDESETGGESPKLKRTLSSFLLDFRKAIASNEGEPPTRTKVPKSPKGPRSPLSPRSNTGKRHELRVVIPPIADLRDSKAKSARAAHSPHSPNAPRKRESASPRSVKFQNLSPHESPLWSLRDRIQFPGKEDGIPTAKPPKKRSTASKDQPIVVLASHKDAAQLKHSPHSPFAANVHHDANVDLSQRMCKPARALWGANKLQTNSGRQRWAPDVASINVRSPAEIDAEYALLGIHDSDLESNSELKELTIRMNSDRPMSKFVFNRGGDPFGTTSFVSDNVSSDDDDSSVSSFDSSDEEGGLHDHQSFVFDTSVSGKGVSKNDDDSLEAVIEGQSTSNDEDNSSTCSTSEPVPATDAEADERAGDAQPSSEDSSHRTSSKNKPGHTSSNSLNSAGASKSALAKATKEKKLKIRAQKARFRKRQAARAERALRIGSQQKIGLCKFGHVDGARVYEDLPKFQLPDGQEIFLYLSGDAIFGRDSLQDVDAPPLAPFTIAELGFSNALLPDLPRLISKAELLPLPDGNLPVAFVPPPVPSSHSLIHYGGKQPSSSVSWTRLGKVLDEALPVKTEAIEVILPVEELQRTQIPVATVTPWNIGQSVFAMRGKPNNAFYNEKGLRNKAFERDWQLCEQKRTFRKFLSRYGETTAANVQGVIKHNYGFVCNIFRYFSALDQIMSIFSLQMLEFSEFCNRALIKESDSASLIQEGHCNTIFIQVTKNTIDEHTSQQVLFEEECKALSLKKCSQLMRHQFLESLVRIAEAKYIKSGIVSERDLAAGCKLLFQSIGDVPLLKRIDGCFDNFRKKQLYSENVDKVLRENLAFLKRMFLQFAGSAKDSKDYGGLKKRRLTLSEWQSMLISVGVFNPNFTLRESNNIFRSSTLDLADEVADWRLLITLSFADFLEAVARLATAMTIPSPEELEQVGADSIVEFYTVMESTGLWTALRERCEAEALTAKNLSLTPVPGKDMLLPNAVGNEASSEAPYEASSEAQRGVHNSAQMNTETKDDQPPNKAAQSATASASTTSAVVNESATPRVEACLRSPHNELPLCERLAQLVVLLDHMQERQRRIALEEKLWRGDSAGLARAQAERKASLDDKAAKILERIREASSEQQGDKCKVEALPETSAADAGSPSSVEESIAKALIAVEEGIPLERFEAHVASTLHDVWRLNRGKEANGSYVSRVKFIKGIEYDIANLSFSELPGHFQMDNLLAAYDACESIRCEFSRFESDSKNSELSLDTFALALQSSDFLETASSAQHSHWLKRNRRKEWVEAHQKVPYEDLAEEDKDKNRDIVKTAVKVWLAHQQKKTKDSKRGQSSETL